MTIDGIDSGALQCCAGDRSTHRGLRSANVGALEVVRRHDPSRGTVASLVDAGTGLEFSETWCARHYRHNRQAGRRGG